MTDRTQPTPFKASVQPRNSGDSPPGGPVPVMCDGKAVHLPNNNQATDKRYTRFQGAQLRHWLRVDNGKTLFRVLPSGESGDIHIVDDDTYDIKPGFVFRTDDGDADMPSADSVAGGSGQSAPGEIEGRLAAIEKSLGSSDYDKALRKQLKLLRSLSPDRVLAAVVRLEGHVLRIAPVVEKTGTLLPRLHEKAKARRGALTQIEAVVKSLSNLVRAHFAAANTANDNTGKQLDRMADAVVEIEEQAGKAARRAESAHSKGLGNANLLHTLHAKVDSVQRDAKRLLSFEYTTEARLERIERSLAHIARLVSQEPGPVSAEPQPEAPSGEGQTVFCNGVPFIVKAVEVDDDSLRELLRVRDDDALLEVDGSGVTTERVLPGATVCITEGMRFITTPNDAFKPQLGR